MSSRAPYGASVQQEIHSLKVRLDFKVAWMLRINCANAIHSLLLFFLNGEWCMHPSGSKEG